MNLFPKRIFFSPSWVNTGGTNGKNPHMPIGCPKWCGWTWRWTRKIFPGLKTKFNPPGKRRFLFIGRNDPMKGIDLLTKLLSEGREFLRWVDWRWPGYPRYSQGLPTPGSHPEFMQQIAERFDFFITTGVADPNPTTILESMSWGFPVICTPQSGYYETTYLRNVYHDNIPRSLEVLDELQYAKEEDLMAMANEARICRGNRIHLG